MRNVSCHLLNFSCCLFLAHTVNKDNTPFPLVVFTFFWHWRWQWQFPFALTCNLTWQEWVVTAVVQFPFKTQNNRYLLVFLTENNESRLSATVAEQFQPGVERIPVTTKHPLCANNKKWATASKFAQSWFSACRRCPNGGLQDRASDRPLTRLHTAKWAPTAALFRQQWGVFRWAPYTSQARTWAVTARSTTTPAIR